MLDLKRKKALITGSSRGIGRAFAIALARLGVDVAVHYAGNHDAAREVEREIKALGCECSRICVDLTSPDCANLIWKEMQSGIGLPDILVLNASVQHRKPWVEVSIAEFEQQINCNIRSAWLLSQKFIPQMAENGWGRVITIGSIHEAKPNPDMLVYAITKAAQTHMAQTLARQYARNGVTVNCLAPGVIQTDRNAAALSNQEWRDRVVARIPAGYLGETVDCAGMLALLCSEEGRYITGQNIFIDGGMSLA